MYRAFSEDKYAILTINRPEASNAVNTAVMEGLQDALAKAKVDSDVRAIVLTGAGERAFVAGGDLKEFHRDLTREELVYEKMSQMRKVLETIVEFPKPVIAAVNGAARGGGGELAAACHFRIGADVATVGFVQIKLDISPGWGGGVLLQRIVGRQKALYMLLTGEILDAQTLYDFGFFDKVVPQLQLLEEATTFAKQLASFSPHAVQGILECRKELDTLSLKEAMERESRLCAKLWMTPEHLNKIR
jgi:enoyl-CoA hydratase/carnithine racemase